MTAPWKHDDHELVVDAAEDEQEFERLMELLLDQLERYARANVSPENAVWQHGDFIAKTMLQWKRGYADGRLGRWTSGDLAEYLLDYFPRKVTVDPETLDAVPECVKGVPCLHEGTRRSLGRAVGGARAGTRRAWRAVQDARAGHLALGNGQVDVHTDAGRGC
jgi:hypothetical protein